MRGNKGTLALAIIAALALAITTAAATAGASSGAAVAAKKKCKKHKKQADSAKKKKCKKKKKTPPGPVSLVRATLTWTPEDTNDFDFDLFVFDASGNRAGAGSDTIPSSTLSPDLGGPTGSETFTDLDFGQHRALSFGVCYSVGGSAHSDYTITYVTSDGVTHTDSQRPGSTFHIEYPGGAPIPDNYCPV